MTLWLVRATVDDRPGFLSVLTASLALRSVNILSVQVHGTEAGAVDDFLVDAPDDLTEEDLLAAVVRGRGRDPWLRRTDAQHLVDPPTAPRRPSRSWWIRRGAAGALAARCCAGWSRWPSNGPLGSSRCTCTGTPPMRP